MWGLCDHLTWGRWSCFLAYRLSMALPIFIGGRLRGSSVVSALASNLKVPGSIPGVGKGISMSDHTFHRVICGDDIKTVRSPSNRVVNWASIPFPSPVQGKSPPPPCTLRNLRQFKMVTCGFYPETVSQTAYSPFDIFWKVFFFFFFFFCLVPYTEEINLQTLAWLNAKPFVVTKSTKSTKKLYSSQCFFLTQKVLF